MVSLTKAIRHKRFKLKDNAPVYLILESMQGKNHELKVENLSLTGIGVSSDEPLSQEDGFLLDSALIPAKIRVNEDEIFLGRVILRTHLERNNKQFYGLNTIDSKIPIDRHISHYIDENAKLDHSIFGFELNSEKFSLANFIADDHSDVDLFDRCKKFAIFNESWKKESKYQYYTIRTPSSGKRIHLNIMRKNKRDDYIITGSNDYLGLANHPKVIAAAKNAIDQYGFGSTGSPVTTGLTKAHEDLCEYLSNLFKKEKTILFNSGYTANLGTISVITSENDLILADMLSHASINDGIQMSKAKTRYFAHNDPHHLEKSLKRYRNEHAGCLIITEGVFSMDGDTAPLPEIVKLAERYNARIMIDEAHSFGVIGERGLGIASKFGLTDQIDILMGTLSKAFGGLGGFVSAEKEVIDWIYSFARPNTFSVNSPPAVAAATLRALQILHEEPEHLINLQNNIKSFILGINELGFSIPHDHESAVIPLLIGDENKLGIMKESLMDDGIFVVPIIYPAVSKKRCRFRMTMMASYDRSDIDYIIHSIEKAMIKADFRPGKEN